MKSTMARVASSLCAFNQNSIIDGSKYPAIIEQLTELTVNSGTPNSRGVVVQGLSVACGRSSTTHRLIIDMSMIVA